MPQHQELGFVTTNHGKYQETRKILGYPIAQINSFFLEPQDITGANIARAKAIDAYGQFKRPVFVDHTSLYLLAWQNFPGGMIGTMLRQVGDAGIIQMMSTFSNKEAIGETAIAFCDGRDVHMFIGEVRGSIPDHVEGIEYTGWDRIFIPIGYTKRYGEMSLLEKNEISQRRIALDKFKLFLQEYFKS
jgi:XTP/dITP diphosphohydrolase